MKTELWQRLAAARQYKGQKKTQTDIAEAVSAELGGSLSRVAVSLWESKNPSTRTTPSLDQLKVISTETGVDLRWLIEDGESLDPKPISNGDATRSQPFTNQRQKVRVEGMAAMDEHGFWRPGSEEPETWEVNTDDPKAYAIRVLTQHFQNVAAPGQCLLVSPSQELKLGRWVLVTLQDGRQTFRTFRGHDYGVWHFAAVNDQAAYLDLPDSEVHAVERIMSVSWTD